MSITLDDKAVDVFKLYDEMTIAYSKDIEDYKTILKATEAMIAQKQRKLQDIKDKTVDLMKTSLENIPALESSVHQPAKKFNYAGVDEQALIPEKEIESGEAAEKQSQAITPPIKVQKTRPARHKKATGKGNAKRTGKSKKPSVRSKDISEKSKDDQLDTSLETISQAKSTSGIAESKCLYHPESPVIDQGRQLCSSCKWKLINNGLKKYDKDPAVISFLKGESTTIPVLGQAMCPVHPAVPSYNQKTGLCKSCQAKAKSIGIQDRQLTKKELNGMRNPLT